MFWSGFLYLVISYVSELKAWWWNHNQISHIKNQDGTLQYLIDKVNCEMIFIETFHIENDNLKTVL